MSRAPLPPSLLLVTLGLFASLGLVPSPSVARSPLDTSPLSDSERRAVDDAFADLDGTHSPGCAVGVIRTGELLYQRGYGMASLEAAVPFDSRSVVYAGSVSKQFVAATVAMAAREGHLSLDDPVRRWFPELPEIADGITVLHLIHHTSGIRDYLELMQLAGVDFATPLSELEVLELIARQKRLNFEPGSRYLYSNSGYFLLAQLVERATGRTLRQYADETLFQPLGMRDSHFHDDRNEVVPRRAAAYSPAEDGGFQVDWSPAFDQVGSGGLLTTIEDLARWDRSFWDGSLGDDFWPGLLVSGRLSDGEALEYAFGLNVDEYRGVPRIEHGGAMFGYRAHLVRFPDQRLTLAALCNLSSAEPGTRLSKVADRLLADVLEPAAEAVGTPKEFADRPTVALDSETLDAMAGEYELFPGLAIELRREGSGLVATTPIRPPLVLRPVDELELVAVDADGEPMQLSIEREGDSIVALRGRFFGEERRAPRLAPRLTDVAELAKWQGSYRSEELGVSYRILIEDGEPVYRIDGRPPEPLVVRRDDSLQTRGARGVAERDASGRVVAFELETGRVQHLRFEREER